MDILSLPWLPPVTLSVIVLFGFLIGYLNGWKTSLYILSWNFLALFISLLTFVFFDNYLIETIKNKISNINVIELLKVHQKEIKLIFGLIYLILITIIGDIFAFILYWIVPPLRKLLKRKLKKNKKNGISNKGVRFVGSGLGIISFVPLASVSASILAITHENSNNFAKINSKLVRGLTFGKYDGAENLLQNIRSYILFQRDNDLKKVVSAIFGEESNSLPRSLTPKQKKLLENILNSKIFVSTISDSELVKSLSRSVDFSKINFSKKPTKLDDSLIPNIKFENRDSFVNAIFKSVVPLTNNKSTDKAQVQKYISTLLDW